MSAHTPGPWAFFGDNNYGGTVEIGPKVTVSVDRADRFDCSLVISREEMEANGRLIAAAPDLLALARLVVSETTEDENGDMPNHPRGALLTLLDAARATIAKAEGRE
jgi:hypothetical protein